MGRGFVDAVLRCGNASAARCMLALALDGSLRVDAARRRPLSADHRRGAWSAPNKARDRTAAAVPMLYLAKVS